MVQCRLPRTIGTENFLRSTPKVSCGERFIVRYTSSPTCLFLVRKTYLHSLKILRAEGSANNDTLLCKTPYLQLSRRSRRVPAGGSLRQGRRFSTGTVFSTSTDMSIFPYMNDCCQIKLAIPHTSHSFNNLRLFSARFVFVIAPDSSHTKNIVLKSTRFMVWGQLLG